MAVKLARDLMEKHEDSVFTRALYNLCAYRNNPYNNKSVKLNDFEHIPIDMFRRTLVHAGNSGERYFKNLLRGQDIEDYLEKRIDSYTGSFCPHSGYELEEEDIHKLFKFARDSIESACKDRALNCIFDEQDFQLLHELENTFSKQDCFTVFNYLLKHKYSSFYDMFASYENFKKWFGKWKTDKGTKQSRRIVRKFEKANISPNNSFVQALMKQFANYAPENKQIYYRIGTKLSDFSLLGCNPTDGDSCYRTDSNYFPATPVGLFSQYLSFCVFVSENPALISEPEISEWSKHIQARCFGFFTTGDSGFHNKEAVILTNFYFNGIKNDDRLLVDAIQEACSVLREHDTFSASIWSGDDFYVNTGNFNPVAISPSDEVHTEVRHVGTEGDCIVCGSDNPGRTSMMCKVCSGLAAMDCNRCLGALVIREDKRTDRGIVLRCEECGKAGHIPDEE